jgi:uncharacterized protein with HEPN domain
VTDLEKLVMARSVAARVVSLYLPVTKPLSSNQTEFNDIQFSIVMISTWLGRLSADIRASAPELPVSGIRATRNLIVHEPERVSELRIASILAHDLPALVRDLGTLIASLPDDAGQSP